MSPVPRSNTANGAADGIYKVNSLSIADDADPSTGVVRWDPARSLWNAAMMVGALVLCPIYFDWTAVVVYLVLLEVTMCAGHSVGFHRLIIHRTFKCPKWLERLLVWSGTLVGMQGPFWVIHSHDLRDWAQGSATAIPISATARAA